MPMLGRYFARVLDADRGRQHESRHRKDPHQPGRQGINPQHAKTILLETKAARAHLACRKTKRTTALMGHPSQILIPRAKALVGGSAAAYRAFIHLHGITISHGTNKSPTQSPESM